MRRVRNFVGCVICSLLAVVAFVGVQRTGFDLPIGPESGLLAVALFGLCFAVVLIGFSRARGRRTGPRRETATPMLMRAPRFHSDRTTGPSSIGIRG
jgi:hypothetical protein